jgi:hypothetical protein
MTRMGKLEEWNSPVWASNFVVKIMKSEIKNTIPGQ